MYRSFRYLGLDRGGANASSMAEVDYIAHVIVMPVVLTVGQYPFLSIFVIYRFSKRRNRLSVLRLEKSTKLKILPFSYILFLWVLIFLSFLFTVTNFRLRAFHFINLFVVFFIEYIVLVHMQMFYCYHVPRIQILLVTQQL